MSGLIAKVKQMLGMDDPDRVNQAADAVEKHATDERIDQGLDRAPGGDRVRDHVPDNAGEKAADAMRDHAGDEEKPQG